MLQLSCFYENFMQGVLTNAESRNIIVPEAFLEEISTYLIEDAELSDNFQIADYINRGMEVHGYDYDEERGILSLVVHEYYQSDSIHTLPKHRRICRCLWYGLWYIFEKRQNYNR